MSRLLVTGGAGFIGSNFVHYWLSAHPEERIVVLDVLTYAGNLANLQCVADHPGFRFVHGNICDSSLVEHLLHEEEIDTIVHFAAESHVDRSIHGPDAFIETNILGTHAVLKAARNAWLEKRAARHRFHHISTDEVYGSLRPDEPAFQESTPYAPNSPYSASKAASDHLVRAYYRTYGLQVTASNCSNNYGPYQFPEKLIPLMIINILHGAALPVYGDGRNRRDWLHVSDHCRGIDLILQKGTAGEVYNIGGGTECENMDLIRLLCGVADELLPAYPRLALKYPQCPVVHGKPASSLITFVTDRAGHDRRYAINSDKLEQKLGYRARIALEQGLRETFTWYLQNEWWWHAVLNGPYRQWIQTQYRTATN